MSQVEILGGSTFDRCVVKAIISGNSAKNGRGYFYASCVIFRDESMEIVGHSSWRGAMAYVDGLIHRQRREYEWMFRNPFCVGNVTFAKGIIDEWI